MYVCIVPDPSTPRPFCPGLIIMWDNIFSYGLRHLGHGFMLSESVIIQMVHQENFCQAFKPYL